MTKTSAPSTGSISEIIHRPPDEFKRWPTNPRLHPPKQRFKLKNSILKFGFTVPALVDEESFILSGHCRVDVAKELGLPTIPTRMVVGWTPAQKRAYVIADNKMALLAEWNMPLLKSELEFLSEQVIDIEDTAFSTAEIDLMFDESGADDPDDLQAEDVVTDAAISQAGDCWQLGEHRLLCASALDSASYATVMGTDRAEMCMTDPPYNVPIDGHACGGGRCPAKC